MLEVIAGTIRQKKEAKRLLIGEEVKLSLFPDSMKLLIKNFKISETHRNNKKFSIWQDTESTYIINLFYMPTTNIPRHHRYIPIHSNLKDIQMSRNKPN